MKIRQGLIKYCSPQAAPELRLKAARLESLPEVLPPEDEVAMLVVLCYDKDAEIAAAAKRSIGDYPAHSMISALDKRLEPQVIKKIIEIRKDDEAVVIMAALNVGLDDACIRILAETGPDEVIAIFADDKDLLKSKPFLVDALAKNPRIQGSLVEKLRYYSAHPDEHTPIFESHNTGAEGDGDEASANEAPAEEAPAGGPPAAEIAPAANAPAPIKAAVKDAEPHNVFQKMKNLSMGQKIKLALTGSKGEREYLIKESNKMVALSVLRNPRITEDEVLRVTNVKGTPEDLLRQISKSKEWLKNYTIRLSMITNPKTPVQASIKLLDEVMDRDLERIARSKNIPTIVSSVARRKIALKAKR